LPTISDHKMSERNESSDDDWDPSPETNTGMLANPMKVEFTDQVIRKNIQEQEGFGDGQEGTEFYGVLLDEDDEAWVKKKYQPGGKGDILSCPYCFTQVNVTSSQNALPVTKFLLDGFLSD